MRTTPPFATTLALFAAAAAAGVGLWAGLELAPDETNRLRDDAFYEFCWAANVAAGHGPMVSEGTTTSGVQLLWSALLVPVAGLLGPSNLPIAAAWLGLALHVATASLWLLRCRDRITGACLGLLWLGNPLLVRECQNGQETALACLAASVLWLWRRQPAPAHTALAVLAVAARSELFGLVAALALWRHHCGVPRAWAAPFAALAAHGIANRMLGGSWLPDSALPMAWLWHQNLAAAGDAAPLASWWWYGRPVLLGGPFALASLAGCSAAVFLVLRPLLARRWRWLPLALVTAAALAGAQDLGVPALAAVMLACWPRRGPRRVPLDLLWLCCGLAAIVALHWAIRWYPRDYYAAPLVVAGIAALARIGRWRWLLCGAALIQLADRTRVEPEPLAGQRVMALAGQTLAAVVPAGDPVGCFNSGLVTFHAAVLPPPERRRAVFNLDGVVDARAFAALRRAALGEWLDEQRVWFVLDAAHQFSLDVRLPHASGRYFGPGFDPGRDLLEVARFDAPWGEVPAEPMRLYWRRGRGPQPPAAGSLRILGRAHDGGFCLAWPAAAGEALELELPGGERRTLIEVDSATCSVVRVPPGHAGARLFRRGQPDPIGALPRL